MVPQQGRWVLVHDSVRQKRDVMQYMIGLLSASAEGPVIITNRMEAIVVHQDDYEQVRRKQGGKLAHWAAKLAVSEELSPEELRSLLDRHFPHFLDSIR